MSLEPIPKPKSKHLKIQPLSDVEYDEIIKILRGIITIKGADAKLTPEQRSIKRKSKNFKLITETSPTDPSKYVYCSVLLYRYSSIISTV